MADKIAEALFETKAIKVVPSDTPFWYTSGRLGPFFINTHFLLENEAAAGEVLKRIEAAIKDDRKTAIEDFRHASCLLQQERHIQNDDGYTGQDGIRA